MIFSHQVSLPNMIYEHDCDTQLPTNIFDDEFYPDMKELPRARPSTEPTPIAYMIAKARLCNEAGNILQATHRVGKHVTYDEVIRFDAKLRQIKHELPPHLKLTQLESSPDPVTLIIARFNIDILYSKIMCLLHRKYLPRARQNSRYTHSRRSAIEASLQALKHLALLSRESEGTGRLRSLGWFIKSTATKDFTLPAMLVVLDLHFDNVARLQPASSLGEGSYLYTDTQRRDMLEILETVRGIWESLADTSMEAFKASKVLDIMLKKVQDPSQEPPVPTGGMGPMDDPMTSLASDALNPSITMPQNMLSPGTLGEFGMGVDPFTSANQSSFMGIDFGLNQSTVPNVQMDGTTAQSSASPMSMFTTTGMPGQQPDLSANFDWVGIRNSQSCSDWNTDEICRRCLKITRRWRTGVLIRASKYMPPAGTSLRRINNNGGVIGSRLDGDQRAWTLDGNRNKHMRVSGRVH